MSSYTEPQPPRGEVWRLVVHPAATPFLTAWLTQRGMELVRYPAGADDLPTWGMSPKDVAKRMGGV